MGGVDSVLNQNHQHLLKSQSVSIDDYWCRWEFKIYRHTFDFSVDFSILGQVLNNIAYN